MDVAYGNGYFFVFAKPFPSLSLEPFSSLSSLRFLVPPKLRTPSSPFSSPFQSFMPLVFVAFPFPHWQVRPAIPLSLSFPALFRLLWPTRDPWLCSFIVVREGERSRKTMRVLVKCRHTADKCNALCNIEWEQGWVTWGIPEAPSNITWNSWNSAWVFSVIHPQSAPGPSEVLVRFRNSGNHLFMSRTLNIGRQARGYAKWRDQDSLNTTFSHPLSTPGHSDMVVFQEWVSSFRTLLL